MRTSVLYLFCAVCLVLTVSCHRSSSSLSLVQADSLLHQIGPDTAYTILQQWRSAQNRLSEADEAYYNLLLTQCQDKLGLDITSDSAILSSLSYYEHHEAGSDKQLQATYYTGIVKSVLGQNEEALAYFKKTEAEAQRKNDRKMELEALVYLAYIHAQACNYRESLRYDFKALAMAKAMDNKQRMGFCYNDICVTYEEMGMADSSIYYSKKMIDYIPYQSAHHQMLFYNNAAVSYKREGYFAEAESLLNHSLQIGPTPHTYYTLACLYDTLNETDKAAAAWDKALEETQPRQRMECLRDYGRWLKKQGRNDEALAVFEQVDSLEKSVRQQGAGERLIKKQAIFEEENRVSNTRKIWVKISAVLLIILFTVIIYQLFRRRKTRHHLLTQTEQLMLLESQLKQSQDKFTEHSKDMTELSDKIRIIKDEQDRELKELKKSHKKTVDRIKQETEKIKTEFPKRMAKGKKLFDQVVANQNISQWDKDERECFFMYCSVYRPDIMASVEKDENNIKGNVKLYRILLGLGKSDEDIVNIMHLSPAAFRMMKSRYNKIME